MPEPAQQQDVDQEFQALTAAGQTAPAPASAAAVPASPSTQAVPASANDDLSGQFSAVRSAAALTPSDADWQAMLGATAPQAPRLAAGAPEASEQPSVAQPQLPSNVSMAQRVLHGAMAVGRDVGSGVLHIVPEVAGGALDAVNNWFQLGEDIAQNAKAAGLDTGYVTLFDKDGSWNPHILSDEEAKAPGQNSFLVPHLQDPGSVTGAGLRALTSFLMGRKAVGTALGAAGASGKLLEALSDFGAGATSMDPNAPRLSNVIQSVAPNFVTNWLQAKPGEEGQMLARLKSGLEMAGLGQIVTRAVKGLKALKNAVQGAREAGPAVAPDGTTGAPAEAPQTPPSGVKGVSESIPQDALERELAAEAKTPAAGVKPATLQEVVSADAAQKAEAAGFPKAVSGDALAPPSPAVKPIEISPELRAKAERYLAQETGALGAPLQANEQPLANMRSPDFSTTSGNPVKVNLNMMNSDAAARDAMARVASEIDGASVESHAAVIQKALSSGITADDLLNGRVQGFDPESLQSLKVLATALRMIRDDMASKVVDAAKAVAQAQGAGDAQAAAEAQARFVYTYGRLNGLTTLGTQAARELGRGVNAFGIPLPTGQVPYAEAVQRIAEATGGPESDEFIKKLAALTNPDQVWSAAQAARSMSGRDWMMYGYYNALLRPRTIIKKAVSDGFMAAWNMASRWTAEHFGSGAVAPGETAALMQGYRDSFTDSLAMARQAFKAGRSQFMQRYSTLDAFDFSRVNELADGSAPIANDAPTGAMRQFFRSLMPTTWIGAFDDFAKMMNYRAELSSLAYRHLYAKGLTGAELEAGMNELLAEPPQWLHQAAVRGALENTFQEPLTGLAGSIAQAADQATLPLGHGLNFQVPFGRILMPFVKVPVNILRWSYTNSPLPLLFPSSRISAELAAGGAARDIAMAKIGLGTAASITLGGLALSGQITGQGPSERGLNEAWRRAGNEPFSVRIGDKAYGYNSVEPVGMMGAIVADTHDIMKFAKEEDAAQLASSLVFGLGGALMSKTYLSGLAEFMGALQNPDAESARYMRNLTAGAAVPGTISDFRSAIDPWMRSHYDLLDTIQSRLPYVSEGLPPQRTVWGDPIAAKEGFMPMLSGTGVARMLSPVQIGPQFESHPIDKWIWEHRLDFPRGDNNALGISRPGIHQSWSAGNGVSAQVQLTPQQHDFFARMAGNELKDPTTGMGARETLDALVEGRYPRAAAQAEWDRSPPAVQALIVQSVVNRFRGQARAQLLQQYPDLEDAVRAQWAARIAALKGQAQPVPATQ